MTIKFKWSEDELNRVSKEMFRLMTSGRSSVIEHWPAFKLAQSLINPIYKYSINNPNQRLMAELKKRVSVHFNDCLKKPEVKVVLDSDAAQAKAREVLSKLGGRGTIIDQQLTAARNSKIVENANEARLKKLIAEQMGIRERDIILTSALSDLGADSLDEIEIGMAIEEEFGFDLNDDDPNLRRIVTIQQMLDYINYKKFPDLPEKAVALVRTLLTGNEVTTLDRFVNLPVITNCPRKFVLVDLETGEQWGALEDGTWGKPIRRISIPKKFTK